MAEQEAQVAARDAQQRDAYACREQHTTKVSESLMPEALEQDVVRIAAAAVERHKQLKDTAQFIKTEMDRLHPPAGKAREGVYHCVVGKSFASAISHEARTFIHVKVDTHHIVLWKAPT